MRFVSTGFLLFVTLATSSFADEMKSGPWEDTCLTGTVSANDCIELCSILCAQHTMGMGDDVLEGCRKRTEKSCTDIWTN